MTATHAPRRSLTQRLWRVLPADIRTPIGIIAALIALAWIVICIAGPAIAPFDPLAQDLPRFTPPGEVSVLGTDELGRDVLSRILAGARVTIALALLLVALSMIIGTIIGTIAGFFGGWIDELLMRLTDLVLAFPTVILAMVTAAALGASLFNAVLAALVVSWPSYARVVRSMVLSLRHGEFVSSGRLLGFSPWKSMRLDILPNVAGPTLVMASLDIGTAALLLSGLSFLGLGAKPPTPEWGSMVSSAVVNFDKWWLGVFPGLAILTVVIAFNFLGDALRDSLDPGSERA
ncbi:MAG: ABC transporter permease [Propionicimonas sp.]|uniref:ABC transporter permease n=1 Tax=Propionicimonas sp. TaxID=1955623 RepID=UPI002B2178A5|nr:ABC transporter permease [Propionicimonas sp.]MEA4945066.1 ABC transporter permease [Propionicimonas sp.]MEA5053053.1 ABC transporter permease [Propionicimonas sp.]MEA5117253.1 ABC transporter permease [Propionicimonas sp.]